MSNYTICVHVQVIALKKASSLNLIQYAILKVYILPHKHSRKFKKPCVIFGMSVQSDDIVPNNALWPIYIPSLIPVSIPVYTC